MFGQPAAEAFQGNKMCIGRSVGKFILQDAPDVTFDVYGLDIGNVKRGKFGKPANNHSVMDLGAGFVTEIIN